MRGVRRGRDPRARRAALEAAARASVSVPRAAFVPATRRRRSRLTAPDTVTPGDGLVVAQDQPAALDLPRAAAQAAAGRRQRRRGEHEPEVVERRRHGAQGASDLRGQPGVAAQRRRTLAGAAPPPARRSDALAATSAAGGADEAVIASAAQVRGSLTVEWPVPGITSRTAPGIRAATRADHSGGVRRSSPPWRISVGTVGYGAARRRARARDVRPAQAEVDLVLDDDRRRRTARTCPAAAPRSAAG